MEPLAPAVIADALHNAEGGSGVVEIRGAHLDGARPGDDEFQRIFGAGNAADADDGDLHGTRGLVNHAQAPPA